MSAPLSREALKELASTFLRSKIGNGDGKRSLEAVADEIGCEDRTLEGHVYGRNLPDLLGFLRLAKLFGPEFVDVILAPVGLRALPRAELERLRHIAAVTLPNGAAVDVAQLDFLTRRRAS
jgi:hypothetical protein